MTPGLAFVIHPRPASVHRSLCASRALAMTLKETLAERPLCAVELGDHGG